MFLGNIMQKPCELFVYSKEFVTKYDCYKSTVHMGKLDGGARMEEEPDENPDAIGLQKRFEIEFDRQFSSHKALSFREMPAGLREPFDYEMYRFMHDFINTYIVDYKPGVDPQSDYLEIYNKKGNPNPKVRYRDRRDRTKLLEYFSKIYSNGEGEIIKQLSERV
jgi:hypothetical protein